ncbi:putative glycoprotein [Hubei myriapoda virus 7]|uniref:putative glycoprotein n=1 Tax=Hubei myriapoda virus 7 TaxID=1922936 RepID=UPI00090AB92E|nr:putative glycoprotein [Hubei myriapoda virus 7]APG78794.1 putative glycoprotein [Hubei myriapoda virus 7]
MIIVWTLLVSVLELYGLPTNPLYYSKLKRSPGPKISVDDLFTFSSADYKPKISVCNTEPSIWAPYPMYRDCSEFRQDKDKGDNTFPVVISLSSQDLMALSKPGFSCLGKGRYSECKTTFWGTQYRYQRLYDVTVGRDKCSGLVKTCEKDLLSVKQCQKGDLAESDCGWMQSKSKESELNIIKMTNVSFDRITQKMISITPTTKECATTDGACSTLGGGTILWHPFTDPMIGCHRIEYAHTPCDITTGQNFSFPWTLNCPEITLSITVETDSWMKACTKLWGKPTATSVQGTVVTFVQSNNTNFNDLLVDIAKKIDSTVGSSVLDENEKIESPADSSSITQYATNILIEFGKDIIREQMVDRCLLLNTKIATAYAMRQVNPKMAGIILLERFDMALSLGETAVGIHQCYSTKSYKILRPEHNSTDPQSKFIPIQLMSGELGFLDPVFTQFTTTSERKTDRSPRLLNLNGAAAYDIDEDRLIANPWKQQGMNIKIPKLTLRPDLKSGMVVSNLYDSLNTRFKEITDQLSFLSETGSIMGQKELDQSGKSSTEESNWDRWIRSAGGWASIFGIAIGFVIPMIGVIFCCIKLKICFSIIGVFKSLATNKGRNNDMGLQRMRSTDGRGDYIQSPTREPPKRYTNAARWAAGERV